MWGGGEGDREWHYTHVVMTPWKLVLTHNHTCFQPHSEVDNIMLIYHSLGVGITLMNKFCRQSYLEVWYYTMFVANMHAIHWSIPFWQSFFLASLSGLPHLQFLLQYTNIECSVFCNCKWSKTGAGEGLRTRLHTLTCVVIWTNPYVIWESWSSAVIFSWMSWPG